MFYTNPADALSSMEPSPICDTHQRYRTINHEYLESVRNVAYLGPLRNGWSLVECEDGRWFVESNSSFDAAPHLAGVSLPRVFPYAEPSFFPNRDDALEFAIERISNLSVGRGG